MNLKTKMMKLRFAFAVSNDGKFEKKHFGDADRYLIYDISKNKTKLISNEINSMKLHDEVQKHGLEKKGNAIIKFLKDYKVHVLVSRQFGSNIKMVNKHFIPVLIFAEQPDEVITILNKHIHWIRDERKKHTDDFKLFTIKSGILKSSIDK